MPESCIHPTAIVKNKDAIGKGSFVGPYCVIGSDVSLGEGVKLHAHVVVDGVTKIGAGTQIFPFASLGTDPQDLKYRGEKTELIIGSENVIREHVTINRGTAGGGGATVVGDKGLFMIGTHIAHDCHIGDHAIFANNATLAGHVTVGDHVVIGGMSAVHQFVRIGAHAMIGGMTGVEFDVIPFGSVMGNRAKLSGLNLVGLKRRGVSRADIHTLRAVYKALFQETHGSLSTRIAALPSEYLTSPLVKQLLSFLSEKSPRGGFVMG